MIDSISAFFAKPTTGPPTLRLPACGIRRLKIEYSLSPSVSATVSSALVESATSTFSLAASAFSATAVVSATTSSSFVPLEASAFFIAIKAWSALMKDSLISL